jgi:tight adherence protein B
MIQPDRSILFLILLFFAVVLLVEGIYYYWRDVRAPRMRVNKRLERLASGALAEEVQATLLRQSAIDNRSFGARILDPIDAMLTQAGSKVTAERFVLMMGLATVAVALVSPLALGFADLPLSPGLILLVALFAGGLCIVVPLLLLSRKAAKRMKLFEQQFPVALDIFVRGLRAGHPVSSALELLVNELPDPCGAEFAVVIAELNYGYDLRDALGNLAKRIQTPDVQMFVVSVAIQSETGGNLADILDGLSKVIRDRQSMVLKVRALASEGKMTGIVLSVLPLLTFMGVFMIQPNFFLDVVEDPWFLPGVAGIACLYCLGVFMMRRMVDLKV